MDKFGHVYRASDGVCDKCGANDYEVEDGEVSRRCTGVYYRFFAGVNFNKSSWYFDVIDASGNLTSNGGFHSYEFRAKYDPELDLVDDLQPLVQNTSYLDRGAARKHMAGIDPEEIDWDAYKAFMRDLQG